MCHHITPIHFISCGPTLVGAVTGAQERAACDAILAAAREDGENPTHLVDCRFRHACRAIELLGYELRSPNGELIDVRGIPNEITMHGNAPTIPEFVSNNQIDGVLACFAGGVPPGQADHEAHVFAVEGHEYFDNNVGDKVVGVDDIPSTLRHYRLSLFFVVRPKTPLSGC